LAADEKIENPEKRHRRLTVIEFLNIRWLPLEVL